MASTTKYNAVSRPWLTVVQTDRCAELPGVGGIGITSSVSGRLLSKSPVRLPSSPDAAVAGTKPAFGDRSPF